jgi:hypothetical protein
VEDGVGARSPDGLDALVVGELLPDAGVIIVGDVQLLPELGREVVSLLRGVGGWAAAGRVPENRRGDGGSFGGTVRTDKGAALVALTHDMPVTAVTFRKAW